MKTKTSLLFMVEGGVIAALYIALTLPLAPIAFGPFQYRLSEALTVLPIFLPAAVPGLFIGCLLSNILNPQNLGLLDIIGGSLASLLAALLTAWIGQRIVRALREGRPVTWLSRVLAFLPPILCNAFIVGTYLTWILSEGAMPAGAWLFNIFSVGLSQTLVLFTTGLLLEFALERYFGASWRPTTDKH